MSNLLDTEKRIYSLVAVLFRLGVRSQKEIVLAGLTPALFIVSDTIMWKDRNDLRNEPLEQVALEILLEAFEEVIKK